MLWTIALHTGYSWEELEDWTPSRFRLLCKRLIEHVEHKERERRRSLGIVTMGDMMDGY